MDMNNFDYKTGVGAKYSVVGDSYVYGATANGSITIENFSVGVRGYANLLTLTDSFDRFSGLMVGGNVYAGYEHNFNFIRGLIGGNITRFDIANVFDGETGVDNPTGYSIYGAIDSGYKLGFGNGLLFVPYVGMGTNNMAILNANDSVFAGRVGVDILYEFEVLGIKYDYAIRATISTNDEIVLGGRIGFISGFDMVGGHVAVDYVNNKIGRGYKISAGMNFVF